MNYAPHRLGKKAGLGNARSPKTYFQWLFTIVAFYILLSMVVPTRASTITPSSNNSQIKVLSSAETEADYVQLTPANSHGVSVNQFSSFTVSERPLKLMHGGMQTDVYSPPKLIIISAPKIILSDNIALIGETADIIFINTSSNIANDITCTSCGFENFGRVTLAAARPGSTIASTMSALGRISTFAGGAVNVTNLTAPGVQSLELIAEQVSTAGQINTHLRGDYDSEGNLGITPDGSQIIAGSGINIYTGTTSLIYETLEVVDTSTAPYSGGCDIGGTLRAAMISVVANCPLQIINNAVLSTSSDALATSDREGKLLALQEGVYLQTGRTGLDIAVQGRLETGNYLQVVSSGSLFIKGSVKAHLTALFAEHAVRLGVDGTVLADRIDVGSEWFSNRGLIQSDTVNIETDKTLYNHFGGRILGQSVKLVSLNGAVINGSRTERAYIPDDLPSLLLSSQLRADDKYGIYYQTASENGTTQANLSAQISASSVRIKAQRFENINPYGLVKPETVRWDAGVDLNVASSRRVYVQAETKIEIEAPEYILNASAILGLNQEGSLDLNTRLLMNQRYRVEAELGVFSRISYDENGGIPTSSRADVPGLESYLVAYSPPGIIYTFGEFTFSDGDQNNTQPAEFVNQFSFFEALSDAHFHDARFQSIGLMMPIRQGRGHQPIRCAAYGCAADKYTSLIEFETLTSFAGDVYGLSSDLIVQTVNQLDDASKQTIIDRFVDERKAEIESESTFVNPTGVGGNVTSRRYVSLVEITPNHAGLETLSIQISRCMTYDYYNGGSNTDCSTNYETYRVSDILDIEAGNNLMNGLPWTANQIAEKAEAFISAQSYRGTLPLGGNGDVNGTYTRTYTVFSITDDNEYIIINYSEKFVATSSWTLSEAQSRAVGYYSDGGSVTLRLPELMAGANAIPYPTELSVVDTTIEEGRAQLHIEWQPLNQNSITYKLNALDMGNSTSYVYDLVGGGVRTVSFRVRACNTVGCSDSSPAVTTTVVIPPSETDLNSCRSQFYRPFTNAYRTTPTANNGYGRIGNHCAVKGNQFILATQYERSFAPGSTQTMCGHIRIYSRDALAQAILEQSTDYPAAMRPTDVQGTCEQVYSTSFSRMNW